jgi:omega-amidase
MQISILQFAPEWLNPLVNLNIIAEMCAQLPEQTDILLLPEMFNTGYVLNPKHLHFQWQAETLVNLQELAARHQILIGGSIPMFRQGKWYNTFIFVGESGLLYFYDKIQLFSMAGEHKYYTAGSEIKYFEYQGYKILPLVCYDLRFPNLSFTKEAPDLIIYSANWPVSRIQHWDRLLAARGIENLCYSIGVNRIGKDQNGFEYPGHSSVYDFNGNTILEMSDTIGIQTISLDKEEMTKIRRYYGFLKDRQFV